MAENPYNEIDEIVYDAIRLNADVLAVIGSASRVLLSDRPVDVRDEPEDATDMGQRIWVLPLRSPIHTEDTSTSAALQRRYRIGLAAGNLDLKALRKLEWNLHCALVKFTVEAPSITGQFLTIESAELGESDPSKSPQEDPDEWHDAIDLTVRIFHPHDAFEGVTT